MSDRAQVPCPKCQRMLTFKFEEPKVITGRTVTLILIEQNVARCAGCGRDYTAGLKAKGIELVSVLELQPTSEIIPPNGVRLPPPPSA